MTKLCKICGKSFSIRPSHARLRFCCSRACMATDLRVRCRGKLNPNYKNAGWHTCETCGEQFHNYQKRSRYCSLSCASVRPENLDRLRKMSLMPRKPRAIRGRRCTCLKCGKNWWGMAKLKYCQDCSTYRKASIRVCQLCGKTFRNVVKRKFCGPKCHRKSQGIRQSGASSHLWKGGKTSAALLFRNGAEYSKWRTAVFQRDDFTCQLCKTKGGRLTVHHIKRFHRYDHLRLYVPNGITLCWGCHLSIQGSEQKWESRFFKMVAQKTQTREKH